MNRVLTLLPVAGATLLIAACSGGGDGSTPAAAPQAATVMLTGRAVDGPLQGAIACLDLDNNDRCDAGEPVSAPTAADGSFALIVPAERAGRHAVVVEVPAEAIDADTGSAVGQPFTLRAPASGEAGAQVVFVSPLSTLVASRMAIAGETLAVASAAVQRDGGLLISPLADFTGSAPAQVAAAVLARLVQLTALEQQRVLGPAIGQTDRQGRLLSAGDLAREAQIALLTGLPVLRDAAADAEIAHASGAAREVALRSAAVWLAEAIGPDVTTVLVAGTRQRLAEPPPANPPVASAALSNFSYTDSNNWQIRTLQSSAADNEADANNRVRYFEVYTQSASTGVNANGVTYSWAGSSTRARAGDLHWDGSQWRPCLTTERFESALRDPQGRSSYAYCNGRSAGVTIRRVEVLDGQRMLDVVRDRIRNFPGQGNFGPSNLAVYGSTVFPTGSYLVTQSDVQSSTAWTYDPRSSNQVTITTAAIAAGGDTRSNPSLACNGGLAAVNASFQPASTLDELIARNRGTPCIFNQLGTPPNVSTNPDEWWGNSTLNIGDVAGLNTLPANTGNYYNTTAALRVSFSGTDGVRYWRCFRRATDNSPRNCTALGIGRYTIANLSSGDRVLVLSTAPALVQQRLGYHRVFVERGGRVYFGFKNQAGRGSVSLRLNLAATNALLSQVPGMPTVRPVTQPGTATGARAAALVSLQGTWGSATGTDAVAFRFGADGRFFIAEARPFLPVTQEQSGAELGWFDYDPAALAFSTLLDVDSNLTAGTSHGGTGPEPIDLAAFTAPGNRLLTDNASLVGMWAVDTRSDLSTPHLIFYPNGKAMLVLHQEESNCLGGTAIGQCPPGVEFFDWSLDAATGVLTLNNLLYDTNGCQGLFLNCPAAVAQQLVNRSATLTLTIAADFQSAAFVSSQGGSGTLLRIANGN